MKGHNAARRWPSEGIKRVPFWVYTDAEIYAREQERIFQGPSWNYVALEVEIPRAGDFVRSYIGDKSVVVLRGRDGGVSVVENRCAHRGLQFCQKHLGHADEIVCPYHQWTYDLDGKLIGMPFRRGVKKQGGFPAEFDLADHGLRRLGVARRNGVIFASFSDSVEPLEEYLSPPILELFDRVCDGRALKVLGYSRQLMPGNWKLMFENIKDPYHASILHVFLVSFGLNRVDQPNRVVIDRHGRHASTMTSRGEQKLTEDNVDMARSLIEGLTLSDPSMLDPVREFPQYTVCMTTVWPNLILQQQSNTLAMRQIITKGPDAFELAWTFFGYADDDAAMTTRRLRQANLMGPSGYVSIDDSETIALAQQGLRHAADNAAVLELDGDSWQEELPHGVTESQIRAFYDYYRTVMDL
jgi:salicylate 5-hydroxylase large subunit